MCACVYMCVCMSYYFWAHTCTVCVTLSSVALILWFYIPLLAGAFIICLMRCFQKSLDICSGWSYWSQPLFLSSSPLFFLSLDSYCKVLSFFIAETKFHTLTKLREMHFNVPSFFCIPQVGGKTQIGAKRPNNKHEDTPHHTCTHKHTQIHIN